MTLDTSVNLWGIALFLLPLIVTAIWSLSKMWRDQQEQKVQINLLSDEQKELKQVIEDKNEKTIAEFKKLELAIGVQKESLVKIETLLNLILHNRIRHEDKT